MFCIFLHPTHFRYLPFNVLHCHNFISLYSNKFIRANISKTLTFEKSPDVKEVSDPIIKKYNKMLVDLDKLTKHDLDIAYATNFGSVRFDSDHNFPNKELSFNKEEYAYITEANYIDELCFKDDFYRIDNSLESKNSKLNIENINGTTNSNLEIQHFFKPYLNDSNMLKNVQKYDGSIKPNNSDYFNYMDSHYFGSYIFPTENNNNQENIPVLPKIDNDKYDRSIKPNNSDYFNYMDSHYFGSYIFYTESNNNQENILPQIDDDKSLRQYKSRKQVNSSILLDDQTRNLINTYDYEKSMSDNYFVSDINDNSHTFHESSHVNKENLEEQLINLIEIVKKNLVKNKHDSVDSLKEDEAEEENEIQSDKLFATEKNDSIKDPLKPLSMEVDYKNIKSAYEYVIEKRKKDNDLLKQMEGISSHKRYMKILSNIPNFSQYTQYDIVKVLANSILYNKDNIVALHKPYGIPMHKGAENCKGHQYNINDLLPHLADFKKEDQLIPCHRLDINTTGVLLLAKNEAKAEELKKLFKNHSIQKTYLAITKGIPTVSNGIIDIPIGEGKIEGYRRMALYPDVPRLKLYSGRAKKAITRYKVLSKANGCALLEVTPITGVKHQVRVHLGFGLGCPVLADHKYSFLTKLAPQKLPGDALETLGLKQNLVRNLPLHLHAFSVSIPGAGKDGQDVFIKAGLPKFFRISIDLLKLNKRNNRLTNDHSEVIYGYE